MSSGSGFYGRFSRTCVSGKAGGHGLYWNKGPHELEPSAGPIPVKPSHIGLSKICISFYILYIFFFSFDTPRKQKRKKKIVTQNVDIVFFEMPSNNRRFFFCFIVKRALRNTLEKSARVFPVCKRVRNPDSLATLKWLFKSITTAHRSKMHV